MNVPFLDLKTPHLELENELVEVFRKCLRNAAFVGGSQVQGFEQEFAQFCETRYCVAVNSGTDALRFALIAAGIGPGDEVITVPNTFIATTEAISQTGATPVFVDIDERTYNMDPQKLEDYLKRRFKVQGSRKKVSNSTNQSVTQSSKTSIRTPHSAFRNGEPKAILPVHLYGQCADMDSILEIANRYGLFVIEDACQAHGAQYLSTRENQWQKAGSMGLAGCFSFYPGKNLGACGEGGAVTTSDENLARKVSMLRDHGQAKKYYHEFEGYNGRLDAIQCGILSAKLKHLSAWNEKRRRNAYLYNDLFAQSSLILRESQAASREGLVSESFAPDASRLAPNASSVIAPFEPSWSKGVYHLYIIRTRRRDELQKFLSDNGISTGLHYPIPLHLQNAYVTPERVNESFPVTENVAKEILSLPMFPGLTSDQITYVAEKVNQFCQL